MYTLKVPIQNNFCRYCPDAKISYEVEVRSLVNVCQRINGCEKVRQFRKTGKSGHSSDGVISYRF